MQKNIIFNIDPEGILNEKQKFDSASSPINKESKQITVNKEDAKNCVNSDSKLKTPLETDYWIYRIIVSSLAFTIITSITGAIWLGANGKETPKLLTALGTGSLGALAGLLAPTPSKD